VTDSKREQNDFRIRWNEIRDLVKDYLLDNSEDAVVAAVQTVVLNATPPLKDLHVDFKDMTTKFLNLPYRLQYKAVQSLGSDFVEILESGKNLEDTFNEAFTRAARTERTGQLYVNILSASYDHATEELISLRSGRERVRW
jgi:hypothetical protein